MKSYETVSEWYEEMKGKGYSVPVQMCQGLAQTMKVMGLNFQEAWNLLEKKRAFFLVDDTYIFNLAWLEELKAEKGRAL
ncbi:hypothetical protein KJ966_11680 [bacterium]|nr:hypothetical protein [bacterium]